MKQDDINRRTKEAVEYLVESLQAGRSEVLVQYLAAMGRFHSYSFGNIMLIARQKPDATRVAGFRTWNSLGRFVNKGERGILILAPMVRRKGEERESRPEETVSSECQLLGFRAAYVFDISQTRGNELPHLTEVQGDVVGLRERLTAWLAGQAIAVIHSADIAPARGVSSGGKITLLPGLPAAEEFATLVHEVAHELLHRGDRRLETSKQVRETEAEAVAFAVCESLGLETGSASADYIQLWHGDAKLLTASLGIIQRTSALILTSLTEKREVDDVGPPSGFTDPRVRFFRIRQTVVARWSTAKPCTAWRARRRISSLIRRNAPSLCIDPWTGGLIDSESIWRSTHPNESGTSKYQRDR